MGGSHSSNNFSSSSTAEDVIRDIDLSGKVILVTGANTGIGKETARVLYKHNAHVIMGCRNQERMDEAIADIKANAPSSKGILEGMVLNLGDLDSVKQFAKDFAARQLPLHILMLNAGQMVPPYAKTPQGFETQMGINHFGHFVLTNLLLPIMKQTSENSAEPVRIVVTSSLGHKMGTISFDDMDWSKRGYSEWKAYGQSKLANILFAKELAKKLQQSNLSQKIHTYSLHPGSIPTELGRDRGYVRWFYKLGSIFMKSIPQGAATQVYCATAPECKDETGLYYSDCNVATPSEEARNDDIASKLWQVSEQLTGVTYPL